MEARTWVVHVKKDPFDVYIGRANKSANLKGSPWANPFRIGAPHLDGSGRIVNREEAVALYKGWILRGEGRHLLKRLGEIEGETLGCWCAPKGGVGAHDPLLCHGQILLLLLEHRWRVIEKKRGQGSQHPPTQEEVSDKDVSEKEISGDVPDRFIFFGSRGWEEAVQIREQLRRLPAGAVIVVGGARGADRIAEQVARRMGLVVEVYPARWDLEGRGAGYKRNERMRHLPGVVGAFGFRMPGKSSGTDHMAGICREAGIETTVQTPAGMKHPARIASRLSRFPSENKHLSTALPGWPPEREGHPEKERIQPVRENKQNRKQFQVIEVPAAGEQRAARIAYTHDTPEKAVETARWGALMNPRSGRLYRVRDRTRKEIIFEIDANRTLPDLLSAVLLR